MLFTHDMTLFSVFVAGMTRPDFEHLDEVFGPALFNTMLLFDFAPREIARMLDWSQRTPISSPVIAAC